MQIRDFSQLPEVEIYTLHELVHRLTLRTMGDMKERARAMAVRAIQDAIRILPGKHSWKYYKRQARFTTSEPVFPQVEYDHSTRLMTITSDHVWPADATAGEVIIGANPYRVFKRVSDTEATLEPDFAYHKDYTGKVTWERRNYHFSREIAKLLAMVSITSNRRIEYLPSNDFHAADRSRWSSGQTSYCTLHNQGNRFGTTEITLLPSPASRETFEATAIVNPIIPKIELVSGEGASVTENTATVSGAEFTNRLVGSIFRLGRDSTEPTAFDSGNYGFQAFITDVPSPTTLTLSESIPSDKSGKGYAISSPIDIHTSTMLEALEDEAFYQYTKNHDHNSLERAKSISVASLIEAIKRDNTISLDSYMWNAGGWWGRWYGGFYTIREEDEEE
jgi:hypothetical protein